MKISQKNFGFDEALFGMGMDMEDSEDNDLFPELKKKLHIAS